MASWACVVLLALVGVFSWQGAGHPVHQSLETTPLERILRAVDRERKRRNDFGDVMEESGEENDLFSILLYERQYGAEPAFERHTRGKKSKEKKKKSKEKRRSRERRRSKEKKRGSKEKKKKGSKERRRKKGSRERTTQSSTPFSSTFDQSMTSTTPMMTSTTPVVTSTTLTTPQMTSTTLTTPQMTSTTLTTPQMTTTTLTTPQMTSPESSPDIFSSTTEDFSTPSFPEGMAFTRPDAETIEPFI